METDFLANESIRRYIREISRTYESRLRNSSSVLPFTYTLLTYGADESFTLDSERERLKFLKYLEETGSAFLVEEIQYPESNRLPDGKIKVEGTDEFRKKLGLSCPRQFKLRVEKIEPLLEIGGQM